MIALLALGNVAHAQKSPTVARTTTLSALFPADKAKSLAATLSPDKPLRYRVRIPQSGGLSGVLVFVRPDESGETPRTWAAELDRQNLIWIAAEDFGNDRPSAQRVLAALAGLALIESTEAVDVKRLYIGGVSGGGRIASQVIMRFPQHFNGALYIVGADFWASTEEPSKSRFIENRYVFITGDRDFNRRDMRHVFQRYQRAGAVHALLMELPGLGHEYPNTKQLGQAIDFLDAR